MRRSLRGLALLLCALAVCLLLPCAGAAESSPADGLYDSYFDDAVFCGDSLTGQLHTFVKSKRKKDEGYLGGARFLYAINYSLYKAASKYPSDSDVQLWYRGNAVSVPDGLRRMQAGKVFLFFGLNDAGANLDNDMERYGRMIDNIRAVNPDIIIIAQSLTPVQKGHTTYRLYPENLDEFNARLEALCREKGVFYLDIATPLKDEEGYLSKSLALKKTDNVHLNNDGVQVWVDTLRAFAREQMENAFILEEEELVLEDSFEAFTLKEE